MVAPVLFVAAAIFFDQMTKRWAAVTVRAAGALPGIPGVFRFIYVENKGAAFSFFYGMRGFLAAVTCAAILCILYLLIKRIVDKPVGRWGLYLILAGALGNLIDRLRLGYVVDMIELTFIRFAIFNVADCLVTVGTLLFVYYILQASKESGGAPLPEQDPPHSAPGGQEGQP